MPVRAVTATFAATGKSPYVWRSGRRRERQQLGHVWCSGGARSSAWLSVERTGSEGPLPGALVPAVLTGTRHRVPLGFSASAPWPGSAAPANRAGAEQE